MIYTAADAVLFYLTQGGLDFGLYTLLFPMEYLADWSTDLFQIDWGRAKIIYFVIWLLVDTAVGFALGAVLSKINSKI